MSQEFIIKLIGIWLGVLARMTIPFWRKLYQGKTVKFNLKYLKRTCASLILSTIFTFALFPKLYLIKEGLFDFESGFKLFCLSFGFGFGFNAILIEFANWFEKKDS